jgi:hypothetical protein
MGKPTIDDPHIKSEFIATTQYIKITALCSFLFPMQLEEISLEQAISL